MARIRTIKPEFPQSESMGRVSREARLAFILLWTLADDEGRLRGNSRMLASLLFPYDDDAPGLIDGWLVELEAEGCLVRYKIDGNSYVQIANWLIHQKIDKPSKSKIPEFDEASRALANPRELSSEDQGSRTKDQGRDKEEHLSGKPDDEAEKILAHLNAKANRDYRPVPSNIKLIRGRLKEGATPAEMRAVIDLKVRQWANDPKMAQYLRPDTLFNATKFAQYIGQLKAGLPVDERSVEGFLSTFEGPPDDGMTFDMEASHA